MVPHPVPQSRIPGGASNLPLPQLTQPYRRVYHPPHSVTAPLQFPLSQPRRALKIFPTPFPAWFFIIFIPITTSELCPADPIPQS